MAPHLLRLISVAVGGICFGRLRLQLWGPPVGFVAADYDGAGGEDAEAPPVAGPFFAGAVVVLADFGDGPKGASPPLRRRFVR